MRKIISGTSALHMRTLWCCSRFINREWQHQDKTSREFRLTTTPSIWAHRRVGVAQLNISESHLRRESKSNTKQHQTIENHFSIKIQHKAVSIHITPSSIELRGATAPGYRTDAMGTLGWPKITSVYRTSSQIAKGWTTQSSQQKTRLFLSSRATTTSQPVL